MSIEAQELVEGPEELEKLAGGMHGEIAVNISSPLWLYLRQKRLGRLFDSSTSFQTEPGGPKREPDVAFVKLERLPHTIDDTVPLAPDLAVEIISGSDDWKNVINKAASYLRAGVGLVWVVDPYTQAVFVFTATTWPDFDKLRGERELEGDPVLPGFRLKVRDIFEGIEPVVTTNQLNT